MKNKRELCIFYSRSPILILLIYTNVLMRKHYFVVAIMTLLIILLLLACEFEIIVGLLFVSLLSTLSPFGANQENRVTLIKGGGGEEEIYYPHYFFKRKGASSHKIVRQFGGFLGHILQSRELPELKHIEPGADDSQTLSRKLDLSKRSKYMHRTDEFKPALHWGQLKLFLSEMEFLTKVVRDAKGRKIIFVYAGAAPGEHTEYLASLFKNVRFELYDPNEFKIKDNDQIHTHVEFFTEKTAEYWAKYPDIYLAFCSDIRTEPPTEENIKRNMKMQLEWWKIMRPELSMFKFRLPWEAGSTEYPEGDIYVQAYPGPSSSETRLICKKDAAIKQYDNNEYEEACSYHNTVIRSYNYPNAIGAALDKCYDCASFEYIVSEYLTAFGKSNTPKDISVLIKDIESNITFGRNSIKSNTARQFLKRLEVFFRLQYEMCRRPGCRICLYSYTESSKMRSVATIENEMNFRKKMGVDEK